MDKVADYFYRQITYPTSDLKELDDMVTLQLKTRVLDRDFIVVEHDNIAIGERGVVGDTIEIVNTVTERGWTLWVCFEPDQKVSREPVTYKQFNGQKRKGN